MLQACIPFQGHDRMFIKTKLISHSVHLQEHVVKRMYHLLLLSMAYNICHWHGFIKLDPVSGNWCGLVASPCKLAKWICPYGTLCPLKLMLHGPIFMHWVLVTMSSLPVTVCLVMSHWNGYAYPQPNSITDACCHIWIASGLGLLTYGSSLFHAELSVFAIGTFGRHSWRNNMLLVLDYTVGKCNADRG